MNMGKDWFFVIGAIVVCLTTLVVSDRLKRYLKARWSSRGMWGEIIPEAVQIFLYLEMAGAYYLAYLVFANAPRPLLPVVLIFAEITPVTGAIAVLLTLSLYYLSRLLKIEDGRTGIT